jgi:Dolichyl-phosphate-mannose-protein mannosyltransferase
MIASLSFVVQHAAALALILLIAAAAGTAVFGVQKPLALRAILGMAVTGQVFVVLGSFGVLWTWVMVGFVMVALAGAAARVIPSVVEGSGGWVAQVARRRSPQIPRLTLGMTCCAIPLFALALYPPIAFDETLYHLPFVRAVAESGTIAWLPDLRFPVFPQLHELLCVPLYLLLGDTATHLVGVAQVLLLAGLLVEWPRERAAGWVAAALVLGSPIVIHLASITYVDVALTLFVAAGFYCVDREDFFAGGLLLGTACSVKYLGWFFAVGAILYCVRRRGPVLAAGVVVGALAMTARIWVLSGSPVFPFLSGSEFFRPMGLVGLMGLLGLMWDVSFDRARVNQQPAYLPLFGVSVLVTFWVAVRDRRAAFLAVLSAVYMVVFLVFLPRDSRYLLPLLPLVSVVAGVVLVRWRAPLIALSVAVGVAYAGYRLGKLGPPPLNAAQREAFLEREIPEYRALKHRGAGRVYVCGAEQLKYFGGDDLYGDVVGPYGTEKVFRDLTKLDARYLLISKRACRPEWQRMPAPPAFEVVYADAGAVLWLARR